MYLVQSVNDATENDGGGQPQQKNTKTHQTSATHQLVSLLLHIFNTQNSHGWQDELITWICPSMKVVCIFSGCLGFKT